MKSSASATTVCLDGKLTTINKHGSLQNTVLFYMQMHLLWEGGDGFFRMKFTYYTYKAYKKLVVSRPKVIPCGCTSAHLHGVCKRLCVWTRRAKGRSNGSRVHLLFHIPFHPTYSHPSPRLTPFLWSHYSTVAVGTSRSALIAFFFFFPTLFSPV